MVRRHAVSAVNCRVWKRAIPREKTTMILSMKGYLSQGCASHWAQCRHGTGGRTLESRVLMPDPCAAGNGDNNLLCTFVFGISTASFGNHASNASFLIDSESLVSWFSTFLWLNLCTETKIFEILTKFHTTGHRQLFSMQKFYFTGAFILGPHGQSKGSTWPAGRPVPYYWATTEQTALVFMASLKRESRNNTTMKERESMQLTEFICAKS